MARLRAPEPATVKPPRNPCFLYRLNNTDPELAADVVAALDDPAWTPEALATEMRCGADSIRRHRNRKCLACNNHGILAPKP